MAKVDFSKLLEEVTDKDLELLQTIAAMPGSYAPSAAQVAKEYDVTRQALHWRINRLRSKGLIEQGNEGGRTYGLLLTHNAKRLLEKALDAGTGVD